jgi:DNA-binding CsgD family transcriptional regulator
MDADFSQLTEREKKICEMLREDLTTAEIAQRLGLSQQSIRHCFMEIYQKVGVKNKEELVKALDKGAG